MDDGRSRAIILHFSKARLLIAITPYGMFRVLIDVFEKAYSPITFSVLGRVNELI